MHEQKDLVKLCIHIVIFFFDTTFDCSSPITIYEILPIGFIANQKLIEVMYVNTVRGVDTTIREKLIRHPPLEGGQLENE